MATTYSNFGGNVTIIASAQALLRRFESEAERKVKPVLEAGGATVYLGSQVETVKKLSGKDLEVQVTSGDTVQGTTILIAARRRPRTEKIGLEELGVKYAAPSSR